MKRLIVTVSYRVDGWEWFASRPIRERVEYGKQWQTIIGAGGWTRKQHAVRDAVRLCQGLWQEEGLCSELRIKGKNGRIQDARTYGRDPRRTKG